VTIEPCELLAIAKRDLQEVPPREQRKMAMAVMRAWCGACAKPIARSAARAARCLRPRRRLLLECGKTSTARRWSPSDCEAGIAKMIGASREMVSRVMKTCRPAAYIEMRGFNIVLRDTIMLRSSPGRSKQDGLRRFPHGSRSGTAKPEWLFVRRVLALNPMPACCSSPTSRRMTDRACRTPRRRSRRTRRLRSTAGRLLRSCPTMLGASPRVDRLRPRASVELGSERASLGTRPASRA